MTNIFLQKKGKKKVGELNCPYKEACPYLNFEPAVKLLMQRNYPSRRVDEMVRNYFITIPFQIQEAATLDGCSSFGIYWRIFMPQAKPAIAVLILFQFTCIWNDLLFGMVLTRSPLARPIMVGLARLQGFRAGTGTNVSALMAGAVLGSLPTILLFVSLLRYFIEGLRLSSAGE